MRRAQAREGQLARRRPASADEQGRYEAKTDDLNLTAENGHMDAR